MELFPEQSGARATTGAGMELKPEHMDMYLASKAKNCAHSRETKPTNKIKSCLDMARNLVNAGAEESQSGAGVELELKWSQTEADLDPFLGVGALNSHDCYCNP